MTMSTSEVMNKGMECLVKGMGLIEAEYFISVIMREKFDYTKWQREYFDRMPAEQLDREASAYEKEHPYNRETRTVYR